MKVRVALLAVACLVPASAAEAFQTGDDEKPELQIVAARGKPLGERFSCEVALPERTVLSVYAVGENEQISHGREVRIMTMRETFETVNLLVSLSRGKFDADLGLKRKGRYYLTVVCSLTAQRDEKAATALGRRKDMDLSWEHGLIVLDAATLAADLADEAPRAEAWVGKAETLLETIERERQDADNWRKKHKAVLGEAEKLAGQCEKAVQESLYGATMSTLLQVFRKMSHFDPGFERPDIAPGSAQEAMILGMTEDIPGALSADWLMKMLRAYCVRARAAVARERMIYPLRFSFVHWERLVENLKDSKASEEAIAEVKARFDELVAASRQSSKLIRNDKEWFKKRVSEATLDQAESVLSGLVGVVKDLGERRRKGEDTRPVGGQEKAARVAFAALDGSLRLIPKE